MSKLVIPLAVFSILALIMLSPIFINFGYWGLHDWDQHFFYHGTAAITMLKFHQFPLWNPFYCGGNPYLANPQSPFLTPFFPLLLIFGTVAGLKIQALLYFLIGLIGMYFLSKELKITGYAAFIPPIVFMLSSWYSLRVEVGHTTFFPFALIPLVFLFYLKSLKEKYYIIFAAFFMSWMFLAGGVYPLSFTAVFISIYALFDAIETRKGKPLVILALMFLLVILFSAVKLLPMIEFTTSLGYKLEDREFNNLALLIKGILSRNQDIEMQNELIGRKSSLSTEEKQSGSLKGTIPWGWHEYSAYLGIPALLLFLFAFTKFRENWKLIALSVIFLVLALGSFSFIPLWDILRNIPFFSSIHIPSRFVIMFVFCASLLAGKSASEIKFLRNKLIMIALIAIITIDMMLVSMPALSIAFPVKPLNIDTYQYYDYAQIYINSDVIISQYPNMLQNLGTWNCYERIHLKQKSVPQLLDVNGTNPYFIGNAYFADMSETPKRSDTSESFDFSYFSPNKIVVEFSTDSQKTLVINQNYYTGWKAKNKEVFSYNGLIAAKVSSGEKKVEFYYLPNSFLIGLLITSASLLLCGAFLLIKYKKPK